MTKYKSFPARKIDSSNVIPIKFQDIVESMKDFERIEGIGVFFESKLGEIIGVHQPGWKDRRIKGDVSELSSFVEIVNVSYSPYINSVLNHWTIHVRGCIKKDKIKVNVFLKEIGLSIIQNWLSIQRTDVWYLNRQCIQIGLNKELSKYCLFETQDGNIIRKIVEDIK